MDHLPLLLFTALLGGCVQGAAGFGFGMVCMSLLATVLDVREAVPLSSMMGLLVGGAVLFRWRSHFAWRNAAPLVIGGLVGVPIGVELLTTLEERWLLLGLGVLLTVYSTWSLVRERRERTTDRRPVSTWWGLPAGLAGGIIGGTFNLGGPPVVLYGMLRGWGQGVFIATIQVVFFVFVGFQLTLLAHKGDVTTDTVLTGAVAAPALLAGVYLGGKLTSKLDPATFRRAVLVMLLLVGGVFLFRALR